MRPEQTAHGNSKACKWTSPWDALFALVLQPITEGGKQGEG